MRVILAGGGTGGHLFPGLAVAHEFQRRDAAAEILFVGTKQGIEARVLPKEGFRLEVLPIRGLKGRGIRGALDALYGIPMSLLRSLAVIRDFRPHFVIGLGGYASGPLLIAAKLKRVRSAIMEQNVRPGFTNKILARFVDRVFTAYRESDAYFAGALIEQTGNPVRWRELPEIQRSTKFTVLIFGGSLGAHRINLAAIDAVHALSDKAPELKIIHQTGQADLAEVKTAYAASAIEAEAAAFIDKMDHAYAAADLVVCRAGASTVAELTAFGKPAILVPYPFAIYDHQRGNALVLERNGAAEMILDGDLSGAVLAERIGALRSDAPKLARMSSAARRLGRPDAASQIVERCYALVEG